MAPYCIFSCNKTLDLYQTWKEAFGLFIPLERCYKNNSLVVRPAIYGLVFVPPVQALDFRAAMRGRFYVDQWLRFEDAQPVIVNSRELFIWQQTINEGFVTKHTVAAECHKFSPGDKVIVELALGISEPGIVERCKKEGRVRVMVRGGCFMDVAHNMLKFRGLQEAESEI